MSDTTPFGAHATLYWTTSAFITQLSALIPHFTTQLLPVLHTPFCTHTTHFALTPHFTTQHIALTAHYTTQHIALTPHFTTQHIALTPHFTTQHIALTPHFTTQRI